MPHLLYMGKVKKKIGNKNVQIMFSSYCCFSFIHFNLNMVIFTI